MKGGEAPGPRPGWPVCLSSRPPVCPVFYRSPCFPSESTIHSRASMVPKAMSVLGVRLHWALGSPEATGSRGNATACEAEGDPEARGAILCLGMGFSQGSLLSVQCGCTHSRN